MLNITPLLVSLLFSLTDRDVTQRCTGCIDVAQPCSDLAMVVCRPCSRLGVARKVSLLLAVVAGISIVYLSRAATHFSSPRGLFGFDDKVVDDARVEKEIEVAIMKDDGAEYNVHVGDDNEYENDDDDDSGEDAVGDLYEVESEFVNARKSPGDAGKDRSLLNSLRALIGK